MICGIRLKIHLDEILKKGEVIIENENRNYLDGTVFLE